MFVQASELTEHVPRIWAVLLAWSVSGVLTLFGALACAELASAFPRTGGVYVFLKETYSPVAGFLWGWAMFWVMHSGIIAAMATVFAATPASSFRSATAGFAPSRCRRSSCISALNYVGVKRGSTVQTAFTVGKVARRRADRRRRIRRRIAAAGALSAGRGDRRTPRSARRNSCWPLIAGLFAFGGWHVVTYTAEETVEPERTIPARARARHRHRHDLLRGAQRRVLLRAAARSGGAVDARRRRRRRRRCSARRAARRSRRW